MTTDWLTIVAVHESAHACVALAFGIDVHEVNIVPDRQEGLAGYALVEDPVGEYQRLGRVFVGLAGIAAERALLRVYARSAEERATDYLMVRKALGESNRKHMPLLKTQAHHMVVSMRRPITTLARALLTHGTLDGDQVDRLVGPACKRYQGTAEVLTKSSRRAVAL